MEINPQKSNFLLVSIIPQKITDDEVLKDLMELKSLVEAFGGKVVDLITQRRELHDKGMYIGKGKIEEVTRAVDKNDIDVVVLNGIVKPGQLFEIKKMILESNSKIQVWDRVDLILQIFALHASSAEAKLQIELASMRHMGPRIYGMGLIMSRQGGGIGTLGVGETNTELMKRHWRDQIKKVEEKLDKHTLDREKQLTRRSRNGLKTVSIIGYTNAGKTSLFNALTGKKNIVENALFVTLDSSVGKVYLPKIKKEILISDTIGFIKNLPPNLIDAFKSTLMESMYAHVLLVVIDASDLEMERKIDVVEDILWSLNIQRKNRIYVFNKIDANPQLKKNTLIKRYREYNPQFISAKKGEGVEDLLSIIEKTLDDKPDTKLLETTSKPRKKIIHV